jgi:3-oxoacyl-[acyl-carrier protein] reductase
MDLGIAGKRAVVTGGSSGIGRSCAVELAREGVRVCVTGRDQGRLEDVVDEIRRRGGDAFWVAADLSQAGGCKAVMDACIERYGGIDILINNAGSAQNANVLDMETRVIDDALNLKLYGFLRMAQLAMPHMRSQQWGRIVNIAGAAGTSPTAANFPASLANVGILNLTRALTDVSVGDGVLVNTICPGITNTPRTRQHRFADAAKDGHTVSEAEVEADIARAGAALRAGRMCEPEEVARVACFLSSEACSYVQASAIYMDGGNRRSTP